MGDVTGAQDARRAWLEVVDEHRDARDAPVDDRYWSRLDTASRDETEAIQTEKLRALIPHLYENVPLYRRRFDELGLRPGDITELADVARVPPIGKLDMAADLAEHGPWGTYTAVDDQIWAERGWQTFATSGTTGAPRIFRYTAFDRETWAWSNARAMYAMGFRSGRDTAMIAFGYGPHVWLWGVHYTLDLMGIARVTAGGLDSTLRARFIDAFRPTILACTPSYALYLADLMRELGLDPAKSSVRYLFCAGEPGFSVPGVRERLQSIWRAELHEFYGCTEAAPSAGGHSCAAVAADPGEVSTHLIDDTHIWEVVDPDTMEPVADGEQGVSVVTNLLSESSPQLRFVVGDYTRLTRERCACGRTSTRALGGFAGRADDMLNVRGVTLFPSVIDNAVRGVAEAGVEYEVVLTRPRGLDELTVRVEAVPGLPADDHDTLRKAVYTAIRGTAELRAEVEILEYGTLPRTQIKGRRVRDLR
jgi:phenylacetate-CoA ligase